MLIGSAELVANIGADAGFYAASANCNQQEAHCKANARMVYSQSQMAETVDDRDVKNRPVLSENGVAEKSADNREKICAGDEYVIPAVCLIRGHQQLVRHEDDQDGIHA